MHGSSQVPGGASSSYVENGWDNLTDQQLLSVRWSTDDPMSLPNLQSAIPSDLGDFQIELAYDLSPEADAVPCAHCPQHQRHRHGFVLRDDRGHRYLLGSTCGPNAYGSDYRLASNARGRSKRRHDLLRRWIVLRDDLPERIDELAQLASSGLSRILRAGRQRLEREAPRTVLRLRQVRPSNAGSALRLFQTKEERDHTAEEVVMAKFLAEVVKLADLGLTNHEFTHRHAELKKHLGASQPIMKVAELEYGTLRGGDWLRMDRCPSTTLDEAVSRLRGLVAIGQSMQDKTTPRLSQIVRQADTDLELASRCAEALEGAQEFFEPRHLSMVCDWLNAGINPPGRSTSVGSKWQVLESHREAVSIDLTPRSNG